MTPTADPARKLTTFEAAAFDRPLEPPDPKRPALVAERTDRPFTTFEGAELDRRLGALIEALRPRPRYLDRILVRNSDRVAIVRVADLRWIEAAGNYVRLHSPAGRPLVRQKIGALETQLDPERFVRIHRSAIVHLERVVELRRMHGGDYSLHLDSGEQLTLSRGYRARFEQVVGRGLEGSVATTALRERDAAG